MGRPRQYNKIVAIESIATIEIISKKYGLFYALIDIEDVDKVKNYTWGVFLNSSNNKFYIKTDIIKNNKKSTLFIHTLLTNCNILMQVDHINHNTLDNTKNNLRIVTIKQNSENLQGCNKNNLSSGIRGISWHKTKKIWSVKIGHNGIQIHGGSFTDLKEAEQKAIELRLKYFTHSNMDLVMI